MVEPRGQETLPGRGRGGPILLTQTWVVLIPPGVLAFHPRALSSFPFRVAAPPLCSLFLFLNFPHLSSPVALKAQLPSLPDVTLQLRAGSGGRGPDLLFLCEPPSFPVYRLQLHRVLSTLLPIVQVEAGVVGA